MNAKKAKALRKKMREVFGDDVELQGTEYVRERTGSIKSDPLTGRRIYQQSKRTIKTGRVGPLQDPGDTAD